LSLIPRPVAHHPAGRTPDAAPRLRTYTYSIKARKEKTFQICPEAKNGTEFTPMLQQIVPKNGRSFFFTPYLRSINILPKGLGDTIR
jgi:hypothetical protein